MLIIPPTQFRKQRGRKTRSTAPAPAMPLNLTGASFDGVSMTILIFDRPVNIDAIDPATIQVSDGVINNALFAGATGGATLLDPQTAQLAMTLVSAVPAGQMLLTASDATGIVASDDGGTWAGVTDLELPFP